MKKKNKYDGMVFKEMYYTKDNVRIVWEDIGEGYNGDFDPEDPDDVALLRFTVCKKNGKYWEQVDDASYCTYAPIDTSRKILKTMLKDIWAEVAGPLNSGYSIKKTCECLSHISPTPYYNFSGSKV